MIANKLNELAGKSVLVRGDIVGIGTAKACASSFQVKNLIQLIKKLLGLGCHIRLLASLGEPYSTKIIDVGLLQKVLSEALGCPVVRASENTDMLVGQVSLLANAFCQMRTDSSELVQEWVAGIDAIVFDSWSQMDTHYAASQGLLNAGLPVYQSDYLSGLEEWRATLRDKRIGLILGGQQAAWQMELASGLSANAGFIALGDVLTGACLTDESFDPLFGQRVISALRGLSVKDVPVLYPVEVLAYHEKQCRTRVCLLNDVEKDECIKDVCLRTVYRIFDEAKKNADVVIFSGTIGQFHDPRFARGTEMLLNFLAKHEVETVLLGHDIIFAAHVMGLIDQFDYLIEGSAYERQWLSEALEPVCS